MSSVLTPAQRGPGSAAIMAILLNLVFNHFSKGSPSNPSVFAASPVREVKTDVIRVLREGDRCEGGKLVDAKGKAIPIVDEELEGPSTH